VFRYDSLGLELFIAARVVELVKCCGSELSSRLFGREARQEEVGAAGAWIDERVDEISAQAANNRRFDRVQEQVTKIIGG
jgi:hypothetical protein